MASTLALLAALMLLASCASMQQQEPREPAAAPAAGAQPQQPAVPPAAPAPAAPPTAEDLGINRDGQPVQFEQSPDVAPAVTPPDNDVVELNFEQEDLRVVLEQLGDALDLNMVIDPTIDDRVSLRTSPDNPLAYDDIWPLIRLLARNAGIAIVQSGDVYQFRDNGGTLPAELVMPEWLNDTDTSVVLQVTPLTYLDAESAREILLPMLGGQEGSIIRLLPGNVLGISGTPEQLTQVNNMLDVIDSDPFASQGIRLYELSNSPAMEVAEELRNVLGLIGGERSTYQVQGLERINAVLVVAPANRGFEEVTRWVNVLDADSGGQGEQLFFYRVRNLNAPALADTLTRVFQQDEDTVVTRVPEEAVQQPELETLPTPDPNNANLPGAPAAQQGGQQNQQNQQDQAQAAGQAGANNQGVSVVSADLSVAIVADEDTNTLLVRATPREYQQLLTTINNLDVAPYQVLINAVIGQVTLSDSTSFGVDWSRVSANLASGPARLSSSFLDIYTPEGNVIRQGNGLILTRTFTDGSAVIDAALQALALENDVTLLARPSLMVTNNQEGEIKVGQAVPVNLGNTVTQNATVANISYRDVGIVLRITPHINDDGMINLEIFQSLSSIEGSSAGVADNPVFANQEITTRAIVGDENTIVLGGLIQDDTQQRNNGIPLLKEIPGVGALFGTQSFSDARRELFVILRPQILSGDGSDAALVEEFRNRFEHVSALLRDAGL